MTVSDPIIHTESEDASVLPQVSKPSSIEQAIVGTIKSIPTYGVVLIILGMLVCALVVFLGSERYFQSKRSFKAVKVNA